jgi:hypothetical protein
LVGSVSSKTESFSSVHLQRCTENPAEKCPEGAPKAHTRNAKNGKEAGEEESKGGAQRTQARLVTP